LGSIKQQWYGALCISTTMLDSDVSSSYPSTSSTVGIMHNISNGGDGIVSVSIMLANPSGNNATDHGLSLLTSSE
jgi:hypothetical protein